MSHPPNPEHDGAIGRIEEQEAKERAPDDINIRQWHDDYEAGVSAGPSAPMTPGMLSFRLTCLPREKPCADHSVGLSLPGHIQSSRQEQDGAGPPRHTYSYQLPYTQQGRDPLSSSYEVPLSQYHGEAFTPREEYSSTQYRVGSSRASPLDYVSLTSL